MLLIRLANWIDRQERVDTRGEFTPEPQSRPEGVVIQAAHRFRAHRDEQRQLIMFGAVQSTPDVLLVPGHAGRDA